jgi:hypothetical protein
MLNCVGVCVCVCPRTNVMVLLVGSILPARAQGLKRNSQCLIPTSGQVCQQLWSHCRGILGVQFRTQPTLLDHACGQQGTGCRVGVCGQKMLQMSVAFWATHFHPCLQLLAVCVSKAGVSI